ncbi:PadR family transcriptional regulator [Cytobacillus solani]|uniref:PadR family transcriptional regulator n=1 Tax=Cytobacillus solani TaxID=1637975 RepID=A0A0Q3QJQ8_9BACI|nr:PadR family transcriptional regulator [Cytobacillus solani]KOP71260.1 PadR family transcriptional regulator [Bacillus sp. FJAT-21945]KQL17798.1 PadR family transcriptional regulator [Cytobacillus solani]USK55609.1 PadR family transcriptional regulator [Cytobacillus solani]
MSEANEHLDKLMQELRRGTLTIGVLSQLYEPQYGYSLVASLEEKDFHVEAGTLYPLLRRLEKQGLLESEWDTNETRPRKYYLLSDSGKVVFEQLVVEWKDMVNSLDNLLKNKGGS